MPSRRVQNDDARFQEGELIAQALAGSGAEGEVRTARQGCVQLGCPSMRIPRVGTGEVLRIAMSHVLADQNVRSSWDLDATYVHIT